ncbi:MAG TPA: hypothetical protein H9894_05530 [Candidatus Desulfovibrio intestinipullorum]|uniref:Uncharacterized protein n=1 Tax=Candidatus Desulfovibrio intestinipullorum TaxID=2838536 RepID=A0A9D1TQM7_9BACT|nr:hypothetical protein [Candidatus Desulfovibrio intestinipullorum]
MTDEQQEQLEDALDHLDQARQIFLELSESVVAEDSNPDDEEEDNANLADEFENVLVTIEELVESIESLRESL